MDRRDYILARDVSPFTLDTFANAVHDFAVCGPVRYLFEVHTEVLLQRLALQPGALR